MVSIRFSHPQGEGGQALMEFALVLLLVAIVVVVMVTVFGTQLHTMYCGATHQLSPEADLSSTCTVPIVMPRMVNRGADYINVEAVIYDPDGNRANPYAQIDHVDFYIDSTGGAPVSVEAQHHYCLGGGDGACNNFNIGGLAAGSHTVIMLAYDDDGHVGRATYRFQK